MNMPNFGQSPYQYGPGQAPPAAAAPQPQPPAQWTPPSAPAVPPPMQFGQPPQYTGVGLSGYGQPPAPAAQGYGPPPGYGGQPAAAPNPYAGYVPQVNWDDPEVYSPNNGGGDFIPYLPNDYTFRLLDLRIRDGVYYADFLCVSVAQPNVSATDQQSGQVIVPCTVGREYCFRFDMLPKPQTEQWKTKKAQQHLAQLLAACRKLPPSPQVTKETLEQFIPASREQLSAFGFMFRCSVSSYITKNHKPATRFVFSPVQ